MTSRPSTTVSWARGVRFVQPPADLGTVITAVFDDTCGSLIQITEEKQQGER